MLSQESLAGKRVLLTGGTTGIGREALAMMLKAGALVVTFGRNAEPLKEAMDYARADVTGEGEVFGITADVTCAEDIERVFTAIDNHLGGLDILIANAALGAEPLTEMAPKKWRYVIETNLIGYMACAEAAIERMRAQGGQLVFISSVSADLKVPGESVYAASKAGVEACAETLRKELQDKHIKVTVIQPGSVRTPMHGGSDAEKSQAVAHFEMLEPKEIVDALSYVLTRPAGTNVSNLRVEPLMQTMG